MKNYAPYLVIIVAISALAYVGFLSGETLSPADNRQGVRSRSSTVWETKMDDQADVTVTVTPLGLSEQLQEWRFDIVMDTHSAELNHDLVAVSILVDNRGIEYKPLRWDGPVGGHHREGALIFAPIMPPPESLELKIGGIGGIERSFTWNIK